MTRADGGGRYPVPGITGEHVTVVMDRAALRKVYGLVVNASRRAMTSERRPSSETINQYGHAINAMDRAQTGKVPPSTGEVNADMLTALEEALVCVRRHEPDGLADHVIREALAKARS